MSFFRVRAYGSEVAVPVHLLAIAFLLALAACTGVPRSQSSGGAHPSGSVGTAACIEETRSLSRAVLDLAFIDSAEVPFALNPVIVNCLAAELRRALAGKHFGAISDIVVGPGAGLRPLSAHELVHITRVSGGGRQYELFDGFGSIRWEWRNLRLASPLLAVNRVPLFVEDSSRLIWFGPARDGGGNYGVVDANLVRESLLASEQWREGDLLVDITISDLIAAEDAPARALEGGFSFAGLDSHEVLAAGTRLLRGPLIGQLGQDVGHIRRVHSQPRVSAAAQGLCGLSTGRACA